MELTLEAFGLLFLIVFGTCSHFIYEWSGHNKLAGIICAVNESTWEHMKLVIGPSLIWMIVEVPFLYNSPNFITAKAVSIVVMMVLIPVIFYGFLLLLKKETLILGILDFVFSAIAGQVVSYWILISVPIASWANYLSSAVLVLILYMYLRFTIKPPKIFLFKDPITNGYGLDGHSH
ncbi:MAG: DUF6512 family protein [Acutalibacteraceae bacterium]